VLGLGQGRQGAVLSNAADKAAAERAVEGALSLAFDECSSALAALAQSRMGSTGGKHPRPLPYAGELVSAALDACQCRSIANATFEVQDCAAFPENAFAAVSDANGGPIVPIVVVPPVPAPAAASAATSATQQQQRQPAWHGDGIDPPSAHASGGVRQDRTTETAAEDSATAAATRLARLDQRTCYRVSGVLGLGAKGLRIPQGNLPPGARAAFLNAAPRNASTGASKTQADADAGAAAVSYTGETVSGWPAGDGSWSLVAWMWLWGGPTEDRSTGNATSPAGGPFEPKFRSLFFKGPGGSVQDRTPSAWLLPDSNRVLMRVSQKEPSYDPDVGVTSVGELPIREWVHVAFTFNNASHPYLQELQAYNRAKLERAELIAAAARDGSGSATDLPPLPAEPTLPSGPSFSYSLYLNGRLDTGFSFRYPTVIGMNDGPLWVGRSDSFAGASALMSDFRLVDGALDADTVLADYTGSAHVYQRSEQCPESIEIVEKKLAQSSPWALRKRMAEAAAAGASAHGASQASLTKAMGLPGPDDGLLRLGISRATALAAMWGPFGWPRSPAAHAQAVRKAEALLFTPWDGADVDPVARCAVSAYHFATALGRGESVDHLFGAGLGGAAEDGDRARTGRIFASSGCISVSEFEGYIWTFEFLGLLDDFVLRDASPSQRGRRFSPRYIPQLDAAASRETEATINHAYQIISNCESDFSSSTSSFEPSDSPLGKGAGSKDAADEPRSDAYESNSTDVMQRTGIFERVYKKYYGSYTGSLRLLEGAAADGSGHPTASRLLADALLQPGRDHCSAELKRTARLWAAGSSLLRQHEGVLKALVRTLLTPVRWLLHGSKFILQEGWAAVTRSVKGTAAQTEQSGTIKTAVSPPTKSKAARKGGFQRAMQELHGRDTVRARLLYAAASMRGDPAALYSWASLILANVGSTISAGPNNQGSHNGPKGLPQGVPTVGDDAFAAGLMHLAAAAGEAPAFAFLARRYDVGEGRLASVPAFARASIDSGRVLASSRDQLDATKAVIALGMPEVVTSMPHEQSLSSMESFFAQSSKGAFRDRETASWYYEWATDAAEATYHARGKQPFYEFQRLTVDAADSGTVETGQRGEDDELIKFQRALADQGDLDAMCAMADLLYWGARGLPRDHAAAFRYWQAAADRGRVAAQVAVGGMLLKGEGVPANHSQAIEYYKKAADQNHTSALNGLGYAYFHGNDGVEKNETAAFAYFLRAAEQRADADSLVNAAWCLRNGLGTRKNMTHAVSLFDSAALSFGNFDAVVTMGRLYASGGIPVQIRTGEHTDIDDDRNITDSSIDTTDASEDNDLPHSDETDKLIERDSGTSSPRKLKTARRVQRRRQRPLGFLRPRPAAGEDDPNFAPPDVGGTGGPAEPLPDDYEPEDVVDAEDGNAAEPHGDVPAEEGRIIAGHLAGVDEQADTDPAVEREDVLVDEDGTVSSPAASASPLATSPEASVPEKNEQKKARKSTPDESEVKVRNTDMAIRYLAPASQQGPWAALVRRGFERYLARDYDGAALHYLHAYLQGFEPGAANAAYLLQKKLADWGRLSGLATQRAGHCDPIAEEADPEANVCSDHDEAQETDLLMIAARREAAVSQQWMSRLLYQYSYARGAADSRLPLADHYFYGTGGLPADVQTAVALYAKASGDGSAQASYNLGYIFEIGTGPIAPDPTRAEIFYRRVLEASPPGPAHVPVYLALARMRFFAWLDYFLLTYVGKSVAELRYDIVVFFGSDSEGTGQGAGNLWSTAKDVQKSWVLKLFSWLTGDTSMNSAHEEANVDDTSSEKSSTMAGQTLVHHMRRVSEQAVRITMALTRGEMDFVELLEDASEEASMVVMLFILFVAVVLVRRCLRKFRPQQ
jgi:TPR repeat protein